MADKYGPIFTVKLGPKPVLVVSSSEMARECLHTNDKSFASRPHLVAGEHMAYENASFGFAPYGPYWREMRKIATIELLSNHRINTFEHIREDELKASMRSIHHMWVEKNEKTKSSNAGVIVEMRKWFGELALKVITRIVVGKPVDEGNKLFRNFFYLSGLFVVGDAMPWLRRLDIGGYEKTMRKTGEEMDKALTEWLNHHKLRRACGEKGNQDFMDVMLSILAGGAYEASGYDGDTIIKSTCLIVILGANDTTKVTLTWALSLLLNNSHVLKKVQKELDEHIGRKRQVRESDLKKLVYLQAVIKETLRLCPAAPLRGPHESTEDCMVAGYHIPARTQLRVNIYKIHRDSRNWEDPNKFQQERFLTPHKEVEVRGQHFELIPFGSGRRVCPGASFALQFMQLVLAALLHGFNITTPSGEPVDMSESPGLTNLKASPFGVCLTPRLPNHLY